MIGLLVASPLIHVLLLSPLGLVFMVYFRRSSWALAVAVFVWCWLWLCSTPLVSHIVRMPLVSDYKYTPIETVPTAQAIVVLGGAIGIPTAERPHPVLTDSSERLWYAAQLYRAGKAPVLLLSGGSDQTVALTSEAEAMQTFLLDLGIPADAMLLEGRSRTTQENARYSAQLLHEQQLHHVLLVTSAFHMRRATLAFEAEGLRVTAAPIGLPEPFDSSWHALLPNPETLQSSTRSIKEWLGLFAAALRSGRIATR